jgi:hypothetical protein
MAARLEQRSASGKRAGFRYCVSLVIQLWRAEEEIAMPQSKLVLLAAGAALLTACEARIGNDAPPVEANASAAGNPWEVKLGPGRMMDIELLAQTGALILNLAGLRRPRRMLARLGALGWIAAADAAHLGHALDRLATLQQIGRLASGHTIDPAEGGEGLVRLVLAATGEPDLDSLRRALAADAARSAAIVTARLERP